VPESDQPANVQIPGEPSPKAVPSTAATRDVFVSYASQDSALANAVVAALERQGLQCWIAPRDVTPGALYADGIIRAINEAKILVLVLSENAVTSPHVGKEVERASSKRRPIVTLRTDAVQLSASLEYFLSESQWIDLPALGTEAAFAQLLAAVRLQLATATSAAPATPYGPLSLTRPAEAKKFWLLAATLAAIGLALVWSSIEKFRLSKRIDSSEHGAAATVVLTRPAGAAAFAPPAHSIAVLPFVNMSGDAKQEYFSDGISEELLNALSRMAELQVAARTSSFSFKAQNLDIGTIARKLNVSNILEGSVRRGGRTARITVELIDAVSGFQIWSQTYDRDLSDILQVQTEVATSVAKQLKIKLAGNEALHIELGGTRNPEAYDAYLRGRQMIVQPDHDEVVGRANIAAFDRAIALDPGFALAYAGRAAAVGNFAIFHAKPSERAQYRQQALEAAEHAVALAPELGRAHLALAQLRAFLLLDYAGAAPEFDRALALDPGNAQAQSAFAGFSSLVGHFDPAIKAARRALILDPQDAAVHITAAQCFLEARDYGEALAALRDAETLNPGSRTVQTLTIETLLASGQTETSRQLCELPATPIDEDYRHHCLALAYRSLGRQADAEREFEQLMAIGGSAYGYAEIYAQWGNKAKALQWLAKAEQLRDPGLQSLKVNWYFDPIRSEPQFKAIQARINFPP
jgi:TolB-like protein